MKLEIDGWVIEFNSDNPQYVFLSHEDHPGDIHVKADDEGFVVDVWNEPGWEVAATLAVTYADLEGDEGDV